MAAALVPMSAVFCVVVSRGVYWVRTRLSCPGGDALELDDRWLGDAVVEDPPGEGGREKAHGLH